MRENRPIFQKLAPVVCKEDDQQDFYVNSVGVYHKSEYVMDKPYNRQALKGNIKQISNEGLTSAESTTPKKWNSALKKVKCETLGFYLDRATSLLAKNSKLNSGPSSNFSSFKDPSFITMSWERKESKKHHPRVSMMDNKGSVLSAPKQHVTRKSMVCLTPNHIKGNKSQYEKKDIKVVWYNTL